MQIKIEIDVQPEELRRFIGLPDVAGLQDEFVQFLREKLQQAGENFDAGAFVKSNLRLLSKSPLLGKLLTPVKDAVGYSDDPDGESADKAPISADAGSDASGSAPSGATRKRRARAGKKTSRRKAKTNGDSGR